MFSRTLFHSSFQLRTGDRRAVLGRLNFFHAQEPLRSVGLLFSEYLICMQAELLQGLLWVGQPIVVKHVGRVGTVPPKRWHLLQILPKA